MKPNWERVKVWVVVSFFVALISALAWINQQRKNHTLSSLEWPEATASIVESTVNELPNSKSGTRMVIELLVEYFAEGERYREPVMRLFPRTSDRDYNNLLREGAKVPLRYNPEDPSSFSMSPLLPD